MPNTNLTVDVLAGTDALHRVVSVCRRRKLQILALTYSDGQINLQISGDDGQMRQIGRWLSALVDVLEVELHEASAGVRALGAQL